MNTILLILIQIDPVSNALIAWDSPDNVPGNNVWVKPVRQNPDGRVVVAYHQSGEEVPMPIDMTHVHAVVTG